MKRLPEAETVFAMAKNDYAALRGMLICPEHFSEAIFGFHAQQATENGLVVWTAPGP